MTSTAGRPSGGFFAGRVAVVTGSTQGIGRAIAVALACRGADVVVNGRKPEPVDDLVAEIRAQGGRACRVVAGVAEDGTAESLVDAAHTSFGKIDLIVNNVGISAAYGPLLSASRATFDKTMSGNTWPAIELLQCAVAAGFGANGGAAVVNVSTIGARQVQPYAGVYAASKSALEALTRVLARELAPRRIRVNAVAPGLVRSRTSRVMWEQDDGDAECRLIPLGRLGEPEDIAKAVLFLLSDQSEWITGTTLVADGGRLLVGDEPAPDLAAALAGISRPTTS